MIKKLAGSVREYLSFAVLSPIMMIIEAVVDVLIPFYMADLTLIHTSEDLKKMWQ